MRGENEEVAVGRQQPESRTCVVGIGASAGGLEAIREMLSRAKVTDRLEGES